MHPAAVGVPAEVRSCTGRGAQETLAQLRVARGRESLSSGENRNGTEQAQGLGLIDLFRQVPNKEKGGGNQWGGSALGAGSLCAGVLIWFHLGVASPVGTRSCSSVVGKVGLPRCALCKHLCASL